MSPVALRSTGPLPVPGPRPRGALRPVEIANAGVFAALAVVLMTIASYVPHLTVVLLLTAVPFAIVALRGRGRAVTAAATAAAFLSFVVDGVTAALGIVVCAVLGGVCGVIRRRGRGLGAVALAAAGLAPVAAGAAVGLLALFPHARGLAFAALRATVAGVIRLAELAGLPRPAGHFVVSLAGTLLRDWPAVTAAAVIVALPAWMLLTSALTATVARRIGWLADPDPLDYAARADAVLDAPVAPLPLELDRAGFRYGGAGADALADIDLTVGPGEFIAVVGRNGAGKSTLVSLLAGAAPSTGRVRRPGRVGLGLPGGTAIVGQRPETQAIGATVAEDLRWGLPPGYPLDVDALLAEVGLSGLGPAATESLSGGQLQRLAIATALARRPALLISDESTSMLDAAGRAEVLRILAALPARTGTTVVHVTHDPAEAARADRVIGLAGGRVTDAAARPGPAPSGQPQADSAQAAQAGEPVIRLRGVAHRFDAGTPWEVTALRSVDLDVRAGEGVLVTGANGSGKSTLAWILAGLLRPTSGTVTADPSVALSFQHARLQLLRPTVAEDILAAAHFDPASARTEAGSFVRAALERVGLDAGLGDRPVDALSGGQLRRVALAGLLASRPRVLVLDEPLAGLDRDSRRGLLQLLGRLRREEDLTLVVVSHDLEDMGLACTRTVEVRDGTLALDDAPGALAGTAGPAPGRPRFRRAGLVLRPLPGTSPLHRLGAGWKLLALVVITLAALVIPGWPLIAVLAATFAAGAAAARLPRSALPRLPWWIGAFLVFACVAAAAGGDLTAYLQAILIGLLFFGLTLLVIWTTRVEELPAAFARLTRPLRAAGAPTGEWAHAVALAVRTLPLLQAETRTLIAARRLRAATAARGGRGRAGVRPRELLDLAVAVTALSGRRAGDLGRAATQRGGMGDRALP